MAQAIAPESRVVYVANDPLVLVHARALLVGSPEGATAYVEADLRDPDLILPEAAEVLDFDQPVAVKWTRMAGQVITTLMSCPRSWPDATAMTSRPPGEVI